MTDDPILTEGKSRQIEDITSISMGFMKAQVLLTANKLDLFTRLSGKPLRDEEIARALKTDLRATRILLNALVALGFLTKRDELYSNAPHSEEFLTRGRPYYIGDILRHHLTLYRRWLHLSEVLQSGRPVERGSAAERSEEETRDFILGMANNARIAAQKLALSLDLRGEQRLLDVGGGPGTYAIAFAQRNPRLTAVVFDLPNVLKITREQLAMAGLTDRISVQPGNYLQDDFGQGFTLVLFSNIIHSLGPEEIRLVFQKAFRCLQSRGKILVKDFLANEERTGPLYSMLFAINMLVGTEKGDTYTYREVSSWLEEAGFQVTSAMELARSSHVVIGEKP